MKRLKSVKKIIFISLILSAIAVLLVLFLIIPLLNQIKGYSKEIISKSQELSLYNQDRLQIREFNSMKPMLSDQMDKVNAVFANADAPIDLIKFWENSAGICGLSIVISPGKVESNQYGWKTMDFRIELKNGKSFSQLLRFLDRIENGIYLVQVQNFLSSSAENSASAVLNITVFSK